MDAMEEEDNSMGPCVQNAWGEDITTVNSVMVLGNKCVGSVIVQEYGGAMESISSTLEYLILEQHIELETAGS